MPMLTGKGFFFVWIRFINGSCPHKEQILNFTRSLQEINCYLLGNICTHINTKISSFNNVPLVSVYSTALSVAFSSGSPTISSSNWTKAWQVAITCTVSGGASLGSIIQFSSLLNKSSKVQKTFVFSFKEYTTIAKKQTKKTSDCGVQVSNSTKRVSWQWNLRFMGRNNTAREPTLWIFFFPLPLLPTGFNSKEKDFAKKLSFLLELIPIQKGLLDCSLPLVAYSYHSIHSFWNQRNSVYKIKAYHLLYNLYSKSGDTLIQIYPNFFQREAIL